MDNDSLPQVHKAVRQGTLDIAGFPLRCYVLDNDTNDRIISRQDLMKALGRSANPGGSAKSSDNAKKLGLPSFLNAVNLIPFINKHLIKALEEVSFTNLKWHKTIGYRAEIIKDLCYVFIDANKAGVLHANQQHIVERCEALIRGFASVGLRALVDEATGFQEIRPRDDLQRYLDSFLLKEYSKWVQRFPDEFFEGIFRMKGWTWNEASTKRPVIVGNYINDFVYKRLAPYILEELQNRNPVTESGYRKAKHHQWLTTEVGHPKLQEHLQGVMAIQRIAGDNWRLFLDMLDKAYPKFGHTLAITFDEFDTQRKQGDINITFDQQLRKLLNTAPLKTKNL